jgi:hypothetical protein
MFLPLLLSVSLEVVVDQSVLFGVLCGVLLFLVVLAAVGLVANFGNG